MRGKRGDKRPEEDLEVRKAQILLANQMNTCNGAHDARNTGTRPFISFDTKSWME